MESIFVILGTLIGAGFASGKEIYIFFYKYGNVGIAGIILSSIVIEVIIYKSLIISNENKIENYSQFLDIVFNYPITRKVFYYLINAFTLITFFIMVAGFGAYFQEELKISNIIGSSILALICYFIFSKGINGVLKVNSIIVPILILVILILGFINIKEGNFEINTNQESPLWIISSLEYSGYNTILLIPVILALNTYLREKEIGNKKNLLISIIVTNIIIILSIIVYLILMKAVNNLNQMEMPVALVVSNMGTFFKMIYGVLILLSILTTSISLGESYLKNTKINYKWNSIFICILSVIVSNIGFSNLINIAYPTFGILGAIQIFKILGEKSKKI